MLSAKLISLLETLDPKEFKRFGQYVASPFFNRNPRLIKLVELLRKHAPHFNDQELEKEAVFRSMYGKGVPYNEQQVYDHVAFLMRLLEGFLAYQHYEQDEVMQQTHLLSALTERKQGDHVARMSRKAEQRHSAKKRRDGQYYFEKYLLAQEANRFYAKQQRREADNSLTRTVENLDVFYLANKLRYTCDMLNRKNIINVSYRPEMIDEVLSYLQNDDKAYLQIPVINIYYRIYKMLTESENESHYQQLVALLTEHSDLFSTGEADDLYGYAQNYCTMQINNGQEQYFEEIFHLYKLLLKKGILINNEVMNHQVYKNIVYTGLHLKEFDWVFQFIETYQRYLAPEFQETGYFYNMASYHYEQKQYDKALKYLQKTDLDDVYYHLSAKTMLMKIYYEMEEIEPLDSLLNSFNVYLKRNKTISERHYQTHRNLLKFVKKLDKLRARQGILSEAELQEQAQTLLSEIEQVGNISNVSWLKEKVREI